MDAKLPTPPFKCATCNKIHDELPDIGYREPAYSHEITGEERARRIQLSSDLCTVDNEHYFIRGLIVLPIQGSTETLGLGVWSTLSKTNFDRYVQHFDEDLSSWEPMFGWLSNRLPIYPDTLSLPLSVQTQGRNTRPLFTCHESDHPIVRDQREGITVEKWWEIVGPVLHQS
jgi:hypothetical protein